MNIGIDKLNKALLLRSNKGWLLLHILGVTTSNPHNLCPISTMVSVPLTTHNPIHL